MGNCDKVDAFGYQILDHRFVRDTFGEENCTFMDYFASNGNI